MDMKKKLRRSILEKRDTLGAEEVIARSAVIFDRIGSLKQYSEAGVILIYMDFKNEVKTGPFIEKCLKEGKRIVLPKVETGNLLSIYEIKNIEKDTVPGCMGILEPNSAILNRENPEIVDLAILPGLAFDHAKQRLGYGAGYFDRFLPLLRPDCCKIGVAYGFQLLEAIPADKYDVPVDMVVTDDLVI